MKKGCLVFLCAFVLLLALPAGGGCKGGVQVECEMDVTCDNGVIEGDICYTVNNLEASGALFYLQNGDKDNGVKVSCVKVDGITVLPSLEENGRFLRVEGLKEGNGPFKVALHFTARSQGLSEENDFLAEYVDGAVFYPLLCPTSGGEYVKWADCNFGRCFKPVRCDYNVRLTLPSVMSVACGALPVGISLNGEKTTYAYGGKDLLSFAFFACDGYMVLSKKWGNRSINYYYREDKEAQKTMEWAVEAVKFYEEKLGDYPHGNLVIAQTDSSGAEWYSGLCALPAGEKTDRFQLAYILARQWFGCAVDTEEYDLPYMGAGLGGALALDHLRQSGQAELANDCLNYAKSSYRVLGELLSATPQGFDGVMHKGLDRFESRKHFEALVYHKGLLFFNGLFELLGEDKFYRGLKRAYGTYKLKKMNAEQFIKCFGASVGAVEKYFNDIAIKGGEVG